MCSWCTCYDDVLYTKELVTHIKDEFCVDDAKTWATGCSNGGMFLSTVYKDLEGYFAGYVFESSMPLVGYLEPTPSTNGTKFIFLHGRNDITVPINGGIDGYNGWIYNGINITRTELANHQFCKLRSYKHVETPYDNATIDHTRKGFGLHCAEYKVGCNGRVMQCDYYGGHPGYVLYDANLVYWFFTGIVTPPNPGNYEDSE